jgi:hypothetical protein
MDEITMRAQTVFIGVLQHYVNDDLEVCKRSLRRMFKTIALNAWIDCLRRMFKTIALNDGLQSKSLGKVEVVGFTLIG